MQKLASEFEKIIIISKNERTVLGSLKDVIINPDNGDMVGIVCHVPGLKKEMVANSSDITGVGTNFIMIGSVDNVAEKDEIIRLKEVLDKEIELIGSKVVDEDGRNLGKLRDYSVNLKTLRLERLYVTSVSFVKLIAKDLLIPSKDIIKIEKGKITVSGGSVRTAQKIAEIVKAKGARAGVARCEKR